MRMQAEDAERVKQERGLEKEESCSIPLLTSVYAGSSNFRNRIPGAEQSRPVQRHGDLQRKEAEAAECLWQLLLPRRL